MKTPREIQVYLEETFAFEDGALINAKKRLKSIYVTPLIGKFLHLITKIHGAKKILEIGTLGGYSAIWLARALPSDGKLISLEVEPEHAEVARENIAYANLTDKVEIILGPALEIMQTLTGLFDLIFLDADKESYPHYIDPMVQITRPGGLILVDNLIRRGKTIDPNPNDPQAMAVSKLNKMLSEDPRLESVILPTLVGYDGGDLDGLSLSRVRPSQSGKEAKV